MRPESTALVGLIGALLIAGEGSRQEIAAQGNRARGYNACRLLTAPEIDALTEKQVLLANVIEEAPERSICQWEDSAGLVFKLTVYWSGGKQAWETWRTAQGLGGAVLAEKEGVHPDSIVRQGVVPGLGDAAYFSELLPSLLLIKDTLFEMELSLIPHPERKFRGLATTLMARR